jgi:hypothetical protein
MHVAADVFSTRSRMQSPRIVPPHCLARPHKVLPNEPVQIKLQSVFGADAFAPAGHLISFAFILEPSKTLQPWLTA